MNRRGQECTDCGNPTMYRHDHVSEVFALTRPTARAMSHCANCKLTIITHDDGLTEMIWE